MGDYREFNGGSLDFPFHVFNQFACFDFISFDTCYLKSHDIHDHERADCFSFKLLQLKIIILSCISAALQFVYFESSLDSFYLINEFYNLMEGESIKQNAADTINKFNSASHVLYPEGTFDVVTRDFTEAKKKNYLTYQKLNKVEFDNLYDKQFCIVICKGFLLGVSALSIVLSI